MYDSSNSINAIKKYHWKIPKSTTYKIATFIKYLRPKKYNVNRYLNLPLLRNFLLYPITSFPTSSIRPADVSKNKGNNISSFPSIKNMINILNMVIVISPIRCA